MTHRETMYMYFSVKLSVRQETAKFSWLVQFSFKLLLIRQCHSNLLLLLFSSSVKKRLIFSFMFIWYTMNWATVDQDTLTI